MEELVGWPKQVGNSILILDPYLLCPHHHHHSHPSVCKVPKIQDGLGLKVSLWVLAVFRRFQNNTLIHKYKYKYNILADSLLKIAK